MFYVQYFISTYLATVLMVISVWDSVWYMVTDSNSNWRGSSHCPHCSMQLAFRQNYLLLGTLDDNFAFAPFACGELGEFCIVPFAVFHFQCQRYHKYNMPTFRVSTPSGAPYIRQTAYWLLLLPWVIKQQRPLWKKTPNLLYKFQVYENCYQKKKIMCMANL